MPAAVSRVFAAALAFVACVVCARAQTVASGPGRVRMADSFRAVAPAGDAATATRAETVRETLTAEEAAAPTEVQLMLRMRHADELERRVAAGETISREEMAARFLPTAEDHQAVADWLTSQGLAVSPAGASRTMVNAKGTPAQFARVFETQFARVKFQGEEHTSATVAPSLPAAVEARVQGVHGLQPHLHPRKHTKKKMVNTADGSPPFLPADILTAYNIASTGLNGAGQTIGVIIDTAPLDTDLTHYWTFNGVPQTLDNYSVVDVRNRAIGKPTGEETLDVEWASGIASGARIVVYACGDLNYSNDGYSRVLDDLQSGAQPNLHQISISFGAGELTGETQSDVNTVHSLFTAITAYGVSIFCSSGDEGAYGNDAGRIEAIYPASDTMATGVGGTSLGLGADSSVVSEMAWSTSGTRSHDSSGGGISIFFARPSWQVGTGVNTSAMRQVPDVALNGDPDTGYYVYFNGKVEQDGGTSVSTPCWAGMCALINQARAAQGLPAISGFNAAVYPLLGTNAFRDITAGTNRVFSCTTGYDLLTGIGVPNFAALVSKLTNATAHPAFFSGEVALSQGVYYLKFPNNQIFSYYEYLSDPRYIYHFDLGFEYWFDAGDGQGGIYFYDFASGHFFYTSPTFGFPYLYDFSLQAFLYYYPNSTDSTRYTSNPRYFYNFSTGKTFTQ